MPMPQDHIATDEATRALPDPQLFTMPAVFSKLNLKEQRRHVGSTTVPHRLRIIVTRATLHATSLLLLSLL